MSEEAQVSGVSDAVRGGSAKTTGMSAGAMLRHLRESAGVDATLVASALKVSLQTLQALEEDRYQALPDMAFARGMASSICRNFGVDPAPVLAQMPSALTTELAPSASGINAPFYNPSDRPAALLPKYVSRPLTVVVALFLLGSLLLWLWPTLPVRLGDADANVQTSTLHDPSATDSQGESQTGTPPVVTDPLPMAEPPPADDAPAADDEVDATGAGEGAVALLSAESGAQAAASDADATAPAAGAESGAPDGGAAGPEAEAAQADDAETDDADDASAAAGDADVDAAADEDLVIAASDESWVSVHDRSGKTLFNRLLEQGETARISGDKPLSATIGRKNAVSVFVHGEPFDHRALGSSTVARFKVE